MAREFNVPARILTGEGALDQSIELLKGLGKKALIITDPVMVELGNCRKVEDALGKAAMPYAIYQDIVGEPNNLMIEEGLKVYRAENCDFLVAIGGGSCLDAMKAIGACAVGNCDIADFMGKKIELDMPNMVAIPTTAGTGSEATKNTIISDTRTNVKMLLGGECMIPQIAVIDPQFTMTAPPKVTANTGLDAYCHCVEAFTSRKAQSLSDTFALSAVKRIYHNLPLAFHDGKNVEARVQMSIAALEAGIAFNNASVTIIHGMSRPIGAMFHIPHGLSNSMLFGVCISYALSGAYDRFAVLGRTIGVASAEDEDQLAAEKFLKASLELVREMEIPTMEEYGVNRDEFFRAIDKMAEDAMVSGSPQNTMREVSKEALMELYRKLWE